MDLRSRIAALQDEWWNRDTEEAYQGLAAELSERGFTDDEAVDFMLRALRAAANEYGG